MSPPLILPYRPPQGCSFDRGDTATAKVSSPCGLGSLTRAVVEHDNSGFGPDWFLNELVVYQSPDPTTKTHFPCHQWLSRQEGDGSTKRVLIPSAPSPRSLGKNYLVTTKTGGMRGAGTDANVFVTLYGNQGCSGRRRLDNDVENFERGRKDTFQIQCMDVGQLERIKICHDNTGVGPGWFLDWVEVRVVGGTEGVWHFPCGAWLDAGEEEGGIERELAVGSAVEQESKDKGRASEGYPYTVQVTTGSRPGASTNANVYVTLHGEGGRGDSGTLWLDGGGRTLRPGQTDSFSVTSPTLVSPLEMVTVGHDNSGVCPGWFLEGLVVECGSSGQRWELPCHHWLCADEEDGRIERELHPTVTQGGRKGEEEEEGRAWQVTVWTSDLRGAGTDANVTLQVHGRNGSSQPHPIGDCPENFEQGECDVFGVSLPDLGTITAVTVSHDGTGPYPEWHLDRMEMRNRRSGEHYAFPCSQWVGQDGGGGSVRLEAVRQVVTGEANEEGKEGSSLANGPSEDYGSDQFESSSEEEEEEEEEEEGEEEAEEGEEEGTNQGVSELDSSITNEYIRQLHLDQLSSIDSSQVQSSDHTPLYSLPKPLTPSPLASGTSASERTGQNSARQSPHTPTTTDSKLIGYEVKVSTADKKHASTSNDLHLVLVGERGTSREMTIRNSQKAPLFQRGQTDTFQMGIRDVGPLRAIRVAHSGREGQRWYLYQIVLTRLVDQERFRFLCRRWVEESRPDDISYIEVALHIE